MLMGECIPGRLVRFDIYYASGPFKGEKICTAYATVISGEEWEMIVDSGWRSSKPPTPEGQIDYRVHGYVALMVDSWQYKSGLTRNGCRDYMMVAAERLEPVSVFSPN